jgi:hypothetical protein
MTRIIEGLAVADELDRMGDDMYRRWWSRRGLTTDHWQYQRAVQLWKHARVVRERFTEESNVQMRRINLPLAADLVDVPSSDMDMQLA